MDVTSQEDLEILFGDEARYNVVEGDGVTEGATFPDGTPWAFCTNWARMVRRIMGERAQIFGFSEEANPGSEIAADCGGHDFAVVDERYIVDGWVKNVELRHGASVIDLLDPANADLIARLYGDRACWERSQDIEKHVDLEDVQERQAALNGTNFSLSAGQQPTL